MDKKLQIKIIGDADTDCIVRLYKDAGWWDASYDQSFVKEMIKGSFCFAGAFLDGEMIGMGRALSDGASDAYIQDVVVLTEFRGQGIGGKIVSAIIECLRESDVDWIGLIGEPGTGSFYEKLGFKHMRAYLPMKLEL